MGYCGSVFVSRLVESQQQQQWQQDPTGGRGNWTLSTMQEMMLPYFKFPGNAVQDSANTQVRLVSHLCDECVDEYNGFMKVMMEHLAAAADVAAEKIRQQHTIAQRRLLLLRSNPQQKEVVAQDVVPSKRSKTQLGRKQPVPPKDQGLQ